MQYDIINNISTSDRYWWDQAKYHQ